MRKNRLKRGSCLAGVSLSIVCVLAGCHRDSSPVGVNLSEENTEHAAGQTQPSSEENPSEQKETFRLSIQGDTSALDASADISELLYGIFLEDINYAVDGGLYGEMIQNRSFEYGELAAGGAKHGWTNVGLCTWQVLQGDGLNENNPSYLSLTNRSGEAAGVGNLGYFSKMAVEEGEVYDFSIYLRSPEEYEGPVTVRLVDTAGTVYAEGEIPEITDSWWKYKLELTASASVSSGLRCDILIEDGTVEMDMVSLFPQNTYMGRENGIRRDLGEALEGLSPKFVRFPGGCAVEGKSFESAYSWKDSIGNGLAFEINGEMTTGDVAARPQGIDIWADLNAASANPYYMTYGIGFYEYFLLCEDLEAEPVPILNCGMSCQIQGASGGIPADAPAIGTKEFEAYVQDMLDLVEFCRGDDSTKWGAVRVAMGHEAPFHLNYIGIGNEQWGEAYFARYEQFAKALKEAAEEDPDLYGGIELIVANGPNAGDTNAWNKIEQEGAEYAELVDEHYYMDPSWFLANTTRYDAYDRESTPVFLGEYAAKSNTMAAALAEAAYMTGLERNGDIVKLAAYAPLFANTTSNQWTPDLIWYSNKGWYPSVNYYVQKIFSNNQGTQVLNSSLEAPEESTSLSGKVGLGTWMTSAVFDDLIVTRNDTGEILYEDTYEDGTMDGYLRIGGTWSEQNGQLAQKNTGAPANNVNGDVVHVGDTNWENYTLTVKATKTGGSEGFLIPICVGDQDNWFHWNIGGWGNTVSCLEQTVSGNKSGQIAETVTPLAVQTNKTYELKVTVEKDQILCYIDGKKVVEYTAKSSKPLYEIVSTDDSGEIIVKLVNPAGKANSLSIDLLQMETDQHATKVTVLKADNESAKNTETMPDAVVPEEYTMEVGNSFVYEVPAYSVTVMRIQP